MRERKKGKEEKKEKKEKREKAMDQTAKTHLGPLVRRRVGLAFQLNFIVEVAHSQLSKWRIAKLLEPVRQEQGAA